MTCRLNWPNRNADIAVLPKMSEHSIKLNVYISLAIVITVPFVSSFSITKLYEWCYKSFWAGFPKIALETSWNITKVIITHANTLLTIVLLFYKLFLSCVDVDKNELFLVWLHMHRDSLLSHYSSSYVIARIAYATETYTLSPVLHMLQRRIRYSRYCICYRDVYVIARIA